MTLMGVCALLTSPSLAQATTNSIPSWMDNTVVFSSLTICLIVLLAVMASISWMQQKTIKKLNHNLIKPNEENIFSTFLANTDGVLIGDLATYKVICCNTPLLHLLKAQESDFVGHPVEEMAKTVWLDQDAFTATFEQVIKHGRSSNCATQYRSFDGSRESIPVITSSRILELNGRLYFVTTVRDNREPQQTAAKLTETRNRFQTLTELAPIGILELDDQLSITYTNIKYEQISGYPEQALLGEPLLKHCHPDDHQLIKEQLAIDNQPHDTFEFRLQQPDQQVRWIAGSASRLPSSANDSGKLLLIAYDITERRAHEQSLKMFRHAVENTASAVLICDQVGTVEYANQRFCDEAGVSKQEIVGTESWGRQPWNHIESDRHGMHQALLQGRSWRGETHGIRLDGQHYWSLVSAAPMKDNKGNVSHYVLVNEDVTELKKHQQEVEYIAYYDQLTGLENRQRLTKRLESSIANAINEKQSLALLHIDLDRFKRFNDSLGHEGGDKLIKTIAERLKQAISERDTLARLSGDEFAILLPTLIDQQCAANMAKKVRKLLSQPIEFEDHDIHLTASIGISLAPKDASDASSLMRHADLAMYRAKEQGKNHLQFFEPQLNHIAVERRFIETEMVKGLKQNQFYLEFQPQCSLFSNRFTSLEALIRWRHPDRGPISPEHFIGVAEDTGFIQQLGSWVLDESFRAIKQLDQHGLTDLKVAVNLSAQQLMDKRIIEQLKTSFEKFQVSPHRIELEITESILMEDIERAVELLNEAKAMGVSIAMDDFGTGYSSLSYLKKLPVDTVKVDRCFVKGLPNDKEDMEIISAVIAIAHTLNLDVIAEGIETEEQLHYLRENNCDFAQGYWLSKPSNIETIAKLILAHTESTSRASGI